MTFLLRFNRSVTTWVVFKCLLSFFFRRWQLISIRVLSYCNAVSDEVHLAMFIVTQVQREASSSMDQAKWAAPPLCGRHQYTSGTKNRRELMKFNLSKFCRNHFRMTNEVFPKNLRGKDVYFLLDKKVRFYYLSLVESVGRIL